MIEKLPGINYACNFLLRTGKACKCTALKNFYNEDIDNRCTKCSFFKTEEQYYKELQTIANSAKSINSNLTA